MTFRLIKSYPHLFTTLECQNNLYTKLSTLSTSIDHKCIMDNCLSSTNFKFGNSNKSLLKVKKVKKRLDSYLLYFCTCLVVIIML